MNTHVENLRRIAGKVWARGLGERTGADYRELIAAAEYIEAHDNLANECRRKVEIQLALRVEAQARAGRLAREARR